MKGYNDDHECAVGERGEKHIAIAVATRGRPASLYELLCSLEAQSAEGWRIVCCLADNDPAASARDVAARGWGDMEVRYAVEPRAGIPFARNASLALAPDAAVYAFVDDDERVPHGWLSTMLDCLTMSGADVVTGPVLPVLPADAPAWAARGGWFERRRFPTGSTATSAATNNTLVRGSVLREFGAQPFDVSLARAGGSDADLFRRVVARGFRIIWCDDAPVHETVPPQRLTYRWVCARQLRTGNGRGWQLRAETGTVGALREAVVVGGDGARWCLQCLLRRTAPGRLGWGRLLYAGGVLLALLGLRVNEYGGPFLSIPGRRWRRR